MYKAGLIAVLGVLVAGQSMAGELASMFGEQRAILDAWPVLSAGEQWTPLQVQEEPGGESESLKAGGKSPGKALLLSALVPGVGEFYAGARKRAALFFGLEVLAWGLYTNWQGKGNDVEDEFRATADSLWDPNAYLTWRVSTNSRHSSITHALPCSSYVDTYTQTGSFGDCSSNEVQQYYELLGKYDQFVPGWSDVKDENGNPVQPTQVDSVEKFDSKLRLDYEKRRDDSNDYLKRASNLAGLILINHVLSAIDAARVARSSAQGADEARLERRTRFLFTVQQGARGQVPMVMAYKPFY